MSKWSFSNNWKATVTTPLGVIHLLLTLLIVFAVALMGEGNVILRIIIIVADILAYFIANIDFRAKRENLKKMK